MISLHPSSIHPLKNQTGWFLDTRLHCFQPYQTTISHVLQTVLRPPVLNRSTLYIKEETISVSPI
jgi:hypothetical protein